MKVQTFLLEDDGTIPNHPRFPLLVYPTAFPASIASEQIRECFENHGWSNSWVNGVFGYHHFHSNAHEVLGCFAGRAEVQFGGEQGVRLPIQAGDCVVIPAGVGHKKCSSSGDFGVVGAYPEGMSHNLCRGDEDPEATRRSIQRTPRPDTDPVAGESGPLLEHWPS